MNNPMNKLTLPLILGIPLLGLVLTTLFYMFVTRTGMQLDTMNKGTLINPPMQMAEIKPVLDSGALFSWSTPEKKWSFVVVGSGQCLDACKKKLYLARQIHLATGKDSLRIQTIYLSLDPVLTPETTSLLQQEYPHFIRLFAERSSVQAWTARQTQKLAIEHAANFYVVDPAGWLMMFYTDDQSYKDVIKDMKFLITNS